MEFRFGIQFLGSLVTIILVAVFAAQAQRPGELLIKKDSVISILQNYRAGKFVPSPDRSNMPSEVTAIDRGSAKRTTANGFRVQIFLGSSRSEAYAEQARFKRFYKDVETYVSYAEPNYRVKVGDFRTRSEAQRVAEGLKSQFSNVFIFAEPIYIYQ